MLCRHPENVSVCDCANCIRMIDYVLYVVPNHQLIDLGSWFCLHYVIKLYVIICRPRHYRPIQHGIFSWKCNQVFVPTYRSCKHFKFMSVRKKPTEKNATIPTYCSNIARTWYVELMRRPTTFRTKYAMVLLHAKSMVICALGTSPVYTDFACEYLRDVPTSKWAYVCLQMVFVCVWLCGVCCCRSAVKCLHAHTKKLCVYFMFGDV